MIKKNIVIVHIIVIGLAIILIIIADDDVFIIITNIISILSTIIFITIVIVIVKAITIITFTYGIVNVLLWVLSLLLVVLHIIMFIITTTIMNRSPSPRVRDQREGHPVGLRSPPARRRPCPSSYEGVSVFKSIIQNDNINDDNDSLHYQMYLLLLLVSSPLLLIFCFDEYHTSKTIIPVLKRITPIGNET